MSLVDTNRTEFHTRTEHIDRTGYGHTLATGVHFLCIISMLESFDPFIFVALSQSFKKDFPLTLVN